MLTKIIIVIGLLVIAAIGLAVKYYGQKHSPYDKKRRINFFKKSELTGNKKDENS